MTHKHDIKYAIFVVESLAHLQGQEARLLPTVDGARTELDTLLNALRTCEMALLGFTERNDIITSALSKAREALAPHEPTRENHGQN